MYLLIADDEENLARALCAIFQAEGYQCDVVYDGKSAFHQLSQGLYDGAILDIMMPEMSGLDVLKELRKNYIELPVLFLSALDDTEDKIKGLDLGANDYVSKPFSSKELLARVRVMLKQNIVEAPIHFQNITLDKKENGLSSEKGNFTLSNTEYELMDLFLKHKDQNISDERIIEKMKIDSKAIRLYVSYLNKKLKVLNASFKIYNEKEYYYIQ